MKPTARLIALAAALAPLFAPVPAAHAQMTFSESGFQSSLMDEGWCKQVQVSPGAGGDTCVYAGVGSEIRRRCPGGPFSTYATGFSFPVGLEFGRGGVWGTWLYVADNGAEGIYRVVQNGTPTLFAEIPNVGALAFPPTGSAYGDYLYAPEAFTGPIYRVSSAGVVTSWNALATTYLKFGPGGAWGTGMYATQYSGGTGAIVKVSSAGAVTTLTSGLTIPEGFDWGFDGDMFTTDLSSGQIYRVKSTGVKTLFATLPGSSDAAWKASEQALYVSSYYGGIYRVTRGNVGVEDGPLAVASLRATPNPSRAGCMLDFALAASGVARVDILDLSGRIVRNLGASWRPAGSQRLAWDGADERGAALAPGAYFCRVTAAGGAQSTRVTRVR